jgi:glycosyltransferase involved in cell wall biosynthesis
MKPLVSIVIPVYNAEKYLEKCLNSIVAQTFQEWECIIVNDGSTDNSLAIIEQFAEQDSRFSYYTIPNTGSAKIPRDTAISYAQSEWIISVDADDFIDADAVEKLYIRKKETDADIVCLRIRYVNSGFANSRSDAAACTPRAGFDMTQIINGKDAMMLTVPVWNIAIVGGLVKRSLHRSLSTFESDKKHMNVDEYDVRELLFHAGRVAFADVNYYYLQHPESITKKFSVKRFDTLISYRMLEELVKRQLPENKILLRTVLDLRMDDIINKQTLFFKYKKSLSNEEIKKARQMIKNNYFDVDRFDVYKNRKMKHFFYLTHYYLFLATVLCVMIVKNR